MRLEEKSDLEVTDGDAPKSVNRGLWMWLFKDLAQTSRAQSQDERPGKRRTEEGGAQEEAEKEQPGSRSETKLFWLLFLSQ